MITLLWVGKEYHKRDEKTINNYCDIALKSIQLDM